MRMLRSVLVGLKKKPDGEESGASGEDDENKYNGATEVLHLGAVSKFGQWRGDNGEPGKEQDADGKGVPGSDGCSHRANMTMKPIPNHGRAYHRDDNPVTRVQPGNPF
jgi:hypothetical protein